MHRLRQYLYDLMRDKKRGMLHLLPKILLYIVSLFYALSIKIWNSCYDYRIFKIHKVNAKVISIGNITLGGTGKTPFAEFIAKYLNKQGKRVAVLIRGYGDDEWRILEKNLPSIPIIKGRDRVLSASKAINGFQTEILILDDGFQHRRLERDLDIVLIDAEEAFGNERIFPRGILREPLRAVRRSDMVVLTKADFGKENIQHLRIIVSGDFKKHKAIEAIYRPIRFLNLRDKSHLDLNVVRNKKVCAVSAIAKPEYFKYMLKNLGADLACVIDYPDHYDYREKDLDYIQKKAACAGCEFIITTEKDMVKLGKFQILVLEIELEITKGMEELVARLNSLNPH